MPSHCRFARTLADVAMGPLHNFRQARLGTDARTDALIHPTASLGIEDRGEAHGRANPASSGLDWDPPG